MKVLERDRIFTDLALPEHLQRFPCMRPWIGSRYCDHRHKRLLVIGESHYLPKESNIHQDPDRWYRSSQKDLCPEEAGWVCTIGCITGKWNRAHSIYRAIQNETCRILRESGVTPDNFPLNHLAFYNYFMRPAVEGESMKGNLVSQDVDVAGQVLRWFILDHRPELVIVTSRFAAGYAKKIVPGYGIPFQDTPHPGSPSWNRVCQIYGGLRGRDLFTRFLEEEEWTRK